MSKPINKVTNAIIIDARTKQLEAAMKEWLNARKDFKADIPADMTWLNEPNHGSSGRKRYLEFKIEPQKGGGIDPVFAVAQYSTTLVLADKLEKALQAAGFTVEQRDTNGMHKHFFKITLGTGDFEQALSQFERNELKHTVAGLTGLRTHDKKFDKLFEVLDGYIDRQVATGLAIKLDTTLPENHFKTTAGHLKHVHGRSGQGGGQVKPK